MSDIIFFLLKRTAPFVFDIYVKKIIGFMSHMLATHE